MGKIQGLYFWGYLDDRGKIHVKYYIDDATIAHYEKMPFVKGIFDPFEAYGMVEARKKIEAKYRQVLQQH